MVEQLRQDFCLLLHKSLLIHTTVILYYLFIQN